MEGKSGSAKRTPDEIYRAHSMDALRQSLLDTVEERIEAVYRIDSLLAQMALELNRGQRLAAPRLTLLFLRNYQVKVGKGRQSDIIPMWAFQKVNAQGGWYARAIKNADRFVPHVTYFKLRNIHRIVAGNSRPIKKLLKEMDALMQARARIIGELNQFKRQSMYSRRRDTRTEQTAFKVIVSMNERLTTYMHEAD